ncbi:MAG: hypothetical protein WBA74_07325 [Cyclobacteriaceae bacterium]
MSEKFSGMEGRFVPLSLSKKWVANFQNTHPDHTQAFYFGSEIFTNLLNEPNCVGIRIYYAQDDDGTPKMVLVGVDAQGSNILRKSVKIPTELRLSNDNNDSLTKSEPSLSGRSLYGGGGGTEDSDEDTGMADGGLPCPEFCGDTMFP